MDGLCDGDPPPGPYCYCGTTQKDMYMLVCDKCKRLFHTKCLKSGKPSIFDGDIFFTLVCANCSETRDEECTRMKLQWLPVVMLALYNLQMTNSGNRGYFRWKEQICSYIDQYWTQFFGHTRKKTTTWHGTVAGVLSSGCPQYFLSGTQELKESGWWRLTECKPPPLDVLSSGKSGSRKQRLDLAREQTSPMKLEGLRSRAGKTSIQAAMELRAKRDSLSNSRENKRAKLSHGGCGAPTTPSGPASSGVTVTGLAHPGVTVSGLSHPGVTVSGLTVSGLTHSAVASFASATSPVQSYSSERLSLESASVSLKDDSASRDDLQLPSSIECTPMRSNSSFDLASDLADQSSQMSFSSTKSDHWFTVRDLVPAGRRYRRRKRKRTFIQKTLPECLLKDDEEEESDLEIDPCALSPATSALTSPMSEVKDPADPLPQMEDILAALESKGRSGSLRPSSVSSSLSLPRPASLTSPPGFISPPGLASPPPRVFSPPASFKIKRETVTPESSLDGAHGPGTTIKQEPEDPPQGTSAPELGTERAEPKAERQLELRAPEVSEPVMALKTEELDQRSHDGSSRGPRTPDVLSRGQDWAEESLLEPAQSEDLVAAESRARRRRQDESTRGTAGEEENEADRCVLLSLYEEKQLLKTLNSAADMTDGRLPAHITRLRRKLIVRQLKRERGQIIFDLDSYMNKLHGLAPDSCQADRESDPDLLCLPRMSAPLTANSGSVGANRILDRFQSTHQAYYKRQVISFNNRLVGSEDDQLQPFKSPYTARLLKPFIRRDYKCQPLKLKLLQEIVAYPHRHTPAWRPPPPAPVDFCYVRPQHISSVNTLCREFFWPGIDLSECLQYPDFSCVVLYKKFVVGFAFMVPDVKYNEAYISFLFTHPEWRGAGIATFMVYHLIQTCMGKDVTLHVSASNPAMMLYQKFGFKSEEFILDFYEKYFPEEVRDSRHAFFLRLHR